MSIFDNLVRFGYSKDLHEHLKGLDTKCETYNATSVYQLVTAFVLVVSFIVMLNYYRGIFHRPRFTGRSGWFLQLLFVVVVTFLFAYLRANRDLSNSNFCKDLVFNSSDCALFGLTAAVYAFVFSFIFSMLFKYFSIHHKNIPF